MPEIPDLLGIEPEAEPGPPPLFRIIVGEQTPKVPELDEPAPVWIKTNKPLLLEFMAEGKQIDNALGIAANQVAWKGQRLMKRFFIHRLGKTPKDPFEFIIDPVIIEKHGEPVTELEGCLSWPGQTIVADRYLAVTVSYWTIDGEHIENRKLDRFTSQVFQHEIDHLEGVPEVIHHPGTPFKRERQKVGRNDPCPCGKVGVNGKPIKFKKCCG